MNEWFCDICNLNFEEMYGEPYIEAHHKIPLKNCDHEYEVKPEDLVLLCPNCHKAVHIYLQKSDADYSAIKMDLKRRILKNVVE